MYYSKQITSLPNVLSMHLQSSLEDINRINGTIFSVTQSSASVEANGPWVTVIIIYTLPRPQ
jgi:hypothetical protein